MKRRLFKFLNEKAGFLTAIAGLTISSLSAQPWQTPDVVWQHNYGGSAYDVAKDIHPTTDGGFIVIGNTNSNDFDVSGNKGATDVWIIKTDSLGAIQWQKTYGGSGVDSGQTIRQTFDGNYIVGATTYSNDSDVTGNHGNSDYWIFKIDNLGNILWSKVYGGSNYDNLGAIKQIADSGFVVLGASNSTDFDVHGNHGGYDYWLLRLNQSGDTIKTRTYGGSGDDHGTDVIQAIGGDFGLTGYSNSSDGDLTGNNGGFDYWILKIDAPSDSIIWQHNFGGTYDEYANALIQNVAQGYVMVGCSNSNDSGLVSNHVGGVGPTGTFDMWIVKLTNTGVLDWENSIGGFKDEVGFKIIQGSVDSSYTICGRSNTNSLHGYDNNGKFDLHVIKINRFGNLDFGRFYGGSKDDFGYGIGLLPNEEYIVAGGAYSNDSNLTANNGSSDLWIAKLGAAVNLSVPENSNNDQLINVYPNPFNSYARLVIHSEKLNGKKNILNIYNTNGQLVESIETGNSAEITLNKDLFTSGMFYYQLMSDGKIVSSGKLIAN